MDTVPSPQQQAAGRPAAGAPPEPPQQFLRLSLGRDAYAVRIDSVREILEVAQLTPLPLMPDFVRGVMNLRGAVVPVIDLAARLGLPATVLARRSCVVMVDVRPAPDEPAHTLGVLVDAVYEVFSAGAAEQEPPPRLGTRIDPAFIRSMVRLRGLPTPELQLATVLDPAVLAELIAAHQPAPLH
jgi:purine-binding chemotaxis protein CheW